MENFQKIWQLDVPPRKSLPELDPPEPERLLAGANVANVANEANEANEGPRLTRGERIARRIDHVRKLDRF